MPPLPTHEPRSFSLRTGVVMVDVVPRRFAHPGCVKHPGYGMKGGNRPDGKRPQHVQLRRRLQHKSFTRY